MKKTLNGKNIEKTTTATATTNINPKVTKKAPTIASLKKQVLTLRDKILDECNVEIDNGNALIDIINTLEDDNFKTAKIDDLQKLIKNLKAYHLKYRTESETEKPVESEKSDEPQKPEKEKKVDGEKKKMKKKPSYVSIAETMTDSDFEKIQLANINHKFPKTMTFNGLTLTKVADVEVDSETLKNCYFVALWDSYQIATYNYPKMTARETETVLKPLLHAEKYDVLSFGSVNYKKEYDFKSECTGVYLHFKANEIKNGNSNDLPFAVYNVSTVKTAPKKKPVKAKTEKVEPEKTAV